MKWMGMDWSFITTNVVALAGIAASFYFSQADLNGHSLTVHLASSSTLQAPADSKIQDLQVIVNGTQIESPFISSLVLINSGSKPISSADFETPVVLSTRNDSKLISAQIAGTDPEEIPVKILIDEGKLKILPFLSNPKDQIRITLVSSGAPDLVVKARVSGVKEIPFEDMTYQAPNYGRAIISVLFFVGSIAMYVFYFLAGSTPGINLGTGTRLITVMCLVGGAVVYVERLAEIIGTGPLAMGAIITLGAIGLIAGYFLNKRYRRDIENNVQPSTTWQTPTSKR
ncbi:hypothetical protein [Pseudomonas laurylsulfatiphila]|uniref:hypothetical protein n=1 Tax=Pseudomonas laurylsulfatiphila TaxID=2011015 RepID=UPI00215ED641|nr:hypothetical protein [Pseudomonas laurylsulfatiphila]UVM06432.1 hypothetical protein LOY25_06945 [Pseudomonas laurylsulfatiphila]